MSVADTLSLILKLSTEMLQLAEQQNIEGLAALEARRSAALATLPAKWPASAPKEAASMRRQLEEILSLDAKAQELLLPWRDQMATLLSKLQPGKP